MNGKNYLDDFEGVDEEIDRITDEGIRISKTLEQVKGEMPQGIQADLAGAGQQLALSVGWVTGRRNWEKNDVLKFLSAYCGPEKIDGMKTQVEGGGDTVYESFVQTHSSIFDDDDEEITTFEMMLVVTFWERYILQDCDERRKEILNINRLDCITMISRKNVLQNENFGIIEKRIDEVTKKFKILYKTLNL